MLFDVRPATAWVNDIRKQITVGGAKHFRGQNPEPGTAISYWLKADADNVRVDISDVTGRVVRTIDGAKTAGLNRVRWNLQAQSAAAAAPRRPAAARPSSRPPPRRRPQPAATNPPATPPAAGQQGAGREDRPATATAPPTRARRPAADGTAAPAAAQRGGGGGGGGRGRGGFGAARCPRARISSS